VVGGALAVCVPIHLFVITACDFRGTPDIIVSALMIFTGCLENIAGPNHGYAQQNKSSPSQ
jgi:hypothetical protein